MSKPQPLRYETIYHIYNRGNNGETIFRQKENYLYFLQLYIKHFHWQVVTFAYALLPNHFHFLVRIKSVKEIEEAYQEQQKETLMVSETLRVSSLKRIPTPSQAFGNVCNAYAKAINKRYGRTGSLFENPFGRIPVTTDAYFYNLITYIHRNPQKHGFVDDFRDWAYTSYDAFLQDKETRVAKTAVFDCYGSRVQFLDAHETELDERPLQKWLTDCP